MCRQTPSSLKELFTFRLARLAHITSALAACANAERYRLGPRDWRIVAMLALSAPMSIKALAREVQVDKSQISRDVAALCAAGLVARRPDMDDRRAVLLALTPRGKALYRRVFPDAVKRNEQLLEVLGAAEREVVEQAISLLTEHGLRMLHPRRSIESVDAPVRNAAK